MNDLDFIREFCKKLPSATEDVKWEHDLCFCVGAKMFAVTSFEDPVSISFKVKDEDFEDLIQKPGFRPAPYLARHKWVLLENTNLINRYELEDYLNQSYELVKAKLPKKILKEIG